MEAQDFITPEQYNKAVAKSVQDTLKPKQISNGCAESDYPFYCDYAVKQILNDPNYGKTLQDREDFLKRGGVVIRTAMQPKAQAAATNAVMNTIPPKDPSRRVPRSRWSPRRPVRSLRWPRTACRGPRARARPPTTTPSTRRMAAPPACRRDRRSRSLRSRRASRRAYPPTVSSTPPTTRPSQRVPGAVRTTTSVRTR